MAQEPPSSQLNRAFSPFLKLFPLTFEWDDDGGRSITIVTEDEHLKNYLKHHKEWTRAVKSFDSDSAYLYRDFSPDQYRGNKIFSFVGKKYSANASGRAIAFSIAIQRDFGYNSPDLGSVTFLPDADVPQDRLAEALLSLYIKNQANNEPAWLALLKAPGQDAIDERLADLKRRYEALSNESADLDAELEDIRQPLRLLYDTGKSLESIVRDVLGRLGAEVEPPPDDEQDHEDGWLTIRFDDSIFEGVIEVKSTKNRMFDEHGLNQVAVWKIRGIQNREKAYKGIYIGSADIKTSVDDRGNPFSESFVRKAQMFETAVLRCEDLYQVYLLHQNGSLETERFWRSLFSTKGVWSINNLNTN